MARIRILKQYGAHEVGTVIEIPGGVASALVAGKRAELTTDPVTPVATQEPKAEKPKAPAKPKAEKPKK